MSVKATVIAAISVFVWCQSYQSSFTYYISKHVLLDMSYFVLNCLGFVPGTTAIRKSHQIPVDSLATYLQNQLSLHQEGRN